MITFEIKQESKIKGFSNTYKCEFRGNEVSNIDLCCFAGIDDKSVTLSYYKKTKKINELIRLFKQLGEKGYFEFTEFSSAKIKEYNELLNENHAGNINIQVRKDSDTTKIRTSREGEVIIIRIKEGK